MIHAHEPVGRPSNPPSHVPGSEYQRETSRRTSTKVARLRLIERCSRKCRYHVLLTMAALHLDGRGNTYSLRFTTPP
jgi:hypothetical protein